MATMTVLDSTGATVTVEKPLTPGNTTASASRPVTIASDDTLVVTIGAKTDAKSTATDGTAVSAMQVLKQISASVQAPPSQPVTNTGTFAVQAAATIASGGVASGAIASGAVASGAFASGAIGSGAMIDLGAIADAAVAAGAAGSLSAKLRSISRDLVANIVLAAGAAVIGAVTQSGVWSFRTQDGTGTSIGSTGGALNVNVTNSSNVGQAAMAASVGVVLASDQKYQTGMSPRGISAVFTTNTRPANTTAYSAGDSISNNATAASVTALTAAVSDTNDDPVTITEVLLASTDTGLAGKRVRAYLFNSDPTASSGVQAGDNAAFSQKIAGYIGSVSGVMETGFFDGTVGRLVPSFNDSAVAPVPNAAASGFIVAKPSSGGKAFWIEYQTMDAWTPSANSTTLIGTLRGFQGRAA